VLIHFSLSSLPLAATGSVDGKVSIWDIQTHRVRHTLAHDVSNCYTDDGQVSSHATNFSTLQDAVIKVQFASNSVNLVTCSADRTVRLWDTRSGECLKKWMGHQDAVLDFAISKYVNFARSKKTHSMILTNYGLTSL
jgi:ribosome assembly protein SQT1